MIKRPLNISFPELKESSDEKMWTLIKKYAHSNISDMVLNADHITRKELEDWLEKQAEQKQEWSSKDEDIFTSLWDMLRNNYVPPKNVEEYIKWLQSLKQRLNGYE